MLSKRIALLFMVVGLITGNASKIAGYYLVFMVVDLLVGLLAFCFEREKITRSEEHTSELQSQ